MILIFNKCKDKLSKKTKSDLVTTSGKSEPPVASLIKFNVNYSVWVSSFDPLNVIVTRRQPSKKDNKNSCIYYWLL